MKKPFYILWAVGAISLLTAYLLSGLSLSVKPEVMSWGEFSGNPQAMAHFAERAGLPWNGTSEDLSALHRVYEESMRENTEAVSSASTVAPNRIVSGLKRSMQRVYGFWQPRHAAVSPHAHRSTIFSGPNPLRWNISFTLVVLILLIAAASRVITSLERSLRV